jgi:hypothetical protein
MLGTATAALTRRGREAAQPRDPRVEPGRIRPSRDEFTAAAAWQWRLLSLSDVFGLIAVFRKNHSWRGGVAACARLGGCGYGPRPMSDLVIPGSRWQVTQRGA